MASDWSDMLDLMKTYNGLQDRPAGDGILHQQLPALMPAAAEQRAHIAIAGATKRFGDGPRHGPRVRAGHAGYRAG